MELFEADPKVYLISAPRFNSLGFDEFAGQYFDVDTLASWEDQDASDAEYLAEVAGRLCYMSFDEGFNRNITKKINRTNEEYLQASIIGNKHGSVLEHANITLLFDNVSVILTHELVRHRAGVAYSQLSGRYVRPDRIGFYIPECINRDAIARGLFISAVKASIDYYRTLANHFKLDEEKDFARKKEITSALRRILGQGRDTKILVTANIRAWRHMIEMRTNGAAEEEIAVLFNRVFDVLSEEYPAFFKDAIRNSGVVAFEHSKV